MVGESRGRAVRKDLIMGGASGYGIDQIRPWLTSIRMSGFSGDVALTLTNTTASTVKWLKDNDVVCHCGGAVSSDGDILAGTGRMPQVERFLHAWELLRRKWHDYRFVVMTDVRDVVFQANPSVWLDSHLPGHPIICSSERVLLREEPWGVHNFRDALGDGVRSDFLDCEVVNMGVIAGEPLAIKDLMLLIYRLCMGCEFPVVDQAILNYLVHSTTYAGACRITIPSDGWAAQLGTSAHVVECGGGIFGAHYRERPQEYSALAMRHEYRIDDGVVRTDCGKTVCIVHQYDRIPYLNAAIVERFTGDLNTKI